MTISEDAFLSAAEELVGALKEIRASLDNVSHELAEMNEKGIKVTLENSFHDLENEAIRVTVLKED